MDVTFANAAPLSQHTSSLLRSFTPNPRVSGCLTRRTSHKPSLPIEDEEGMALFAGSLAEGAKSYREKRSRLDVTFANAAPLSQHTSSLLRSFTPNPRVSGCLTRRTSHKPSLPIEDEEGMALFAGSPAEGAKSYREKRSRLDETFANAAPLSQHTSSLLRSFTPNPRVSGCLTRRTSHKPPLPIEDEEGMALFAGSPAEGAKSYREKRSARIWEGMASFLSNPMPFPDKNDRTKLSRTQHP
ncbi:hypothetical protein [Paenibacillus sp. FSL H7-0326]|uniref:hypothetical protein n=1 Tax=Paenibacillus sp. FSL H7-0326 TaxID=1921144 RepID=UPI00117CA2C7|nr:hypothetical protein [Paenibacillus sp. FSL H7-0326]